MALQNLQNLRRSPAETVGLHLERFHVLLSLFRSEMIWLSEDWYCKDILERQIRILRLSSRGNVRPLRKIRPWRELVKITVPALKSGQGDYDQAQI